MANTTNEFYDIVSQKQMDIKSISEMLPAPIMFRFFLLFFFVGGGKQRKDQLSPG
jgi:hypothetical protein